MLADYWRARTHRESLTRVTSGPVSLAESLRRRSGTGIDSGCVMHPHLECPVVSRSPIWEASDG